MLSIWQDILTVAISVVGVIILLCGLTLVIVYRRVLVNINIGAKRIVTDKVTRPGDIRWDGAILKVRFLWSRRRFMINQATIVFGYSTEDYGLDNGEEFVGVRFGNSGTVLFNANVNEQVQLLNQLAEKLAIDSRNWSKDSYPGEENDPVVFYKKEEKK